MLKMEGGEGQLSPLSSIPQPRVYYCPGASVGKHKQYARILHELKLRSEGGCPACTVVYEGLTSILLETKLNDLPQQEFQVSWGYWSESTLTVSIHHGSGWKRMVEFVHHLEQNETLNFLPWLRFGGTVSRHPETALPHAIDWITECYNMHTDCTLRSEGTLPRRVIDVESTSHPFLYESGGERTRYVALSHRWGVGPLLKTTKATLESLKEIIDYNDLSRTFRDAIDVTNKLGIRYLWIDSLCIYSDRPQNQAH